MGRAGCTRACIGATSAKNFAKQAKQRLNFMGITLPSIIYKYFFKYFLLLLILKFII